MKTISQSKTIEAMKTNFLNIMLGGAMLMTLASVLSCSKEQLSEPQPEAGKYTITVAAGQAEALTRTTIEGSDAEGYAAKWAVDDKAGLFLCKTDDSASDEKNVQMSISAIGGDGTAYFTGELVSEPAAGTVYFYYPYGSAATDLEMTRTLPAVQTPTNGACDGKYDFMYGSAAADVVDGKLSVGTISMKYIVGFMNLKVVGCPEEMASDVVKRVSVVASSGKELTGSFTWDLKTGAKTVASSSNVVAANFSEEVKLSELDAWFCTLPFADESLTFRIVTDKHFFEKVVPVSGFSLKTGGLKRFDATIDSAKGWTVSASPYAGGEITTPEAFLAFCETVNAGTSYIKDGSSVKATGGDPLVSLPTGTSFSHTGIDKWLLDDGNGGKEVRLGGSFELNDELLAQYGIASVWAWAGTFNGNGKTITFNGNSCRRPIFANVFGGTVKNLTVAGTMGTVLDSPGYQGVCPLVGVLHGGLIQNCTNDVAIKINTHFGNIGLAGICRTMQNGTIENCTNNGEIAFNATLTASTNIYAGGIVALVGKNYGTGSFGSASSDASEPFAGAVTISGCTNSKPVSLTNTATNAGNRMQYCAVGGIVGWIWGGVPENDRYVTIRNCENSGSLTVDEKSFTSRTTGIAGVGGILGWAAPVATQGRILGPVYGSGDDESKCVEGFYLKIIDSHNYAAATISASRKCGGGGSSEVGSAAYTHKVGCGGIAGILFGQYKGSMAEISVCTSDGTVIGYVDDTDKDNLGQGSRYNVSGGIVGYGGSVNVSDCSVSGNVGKGGYNFSAAGIIGCAYQKFVISGTKVKGLTVYRGNNQPIVIYASLIANYASSMKRTGYSVYSGTNVVDSQISGTVGGSKKEKTTVNDYPSLLEDSGIIGEVDYKPYCVLSNQDIASGNADKGPIKLGYITISGTTHYTE